MTSFSSTHRADTLQVLGEEYFDLIVIGGGATGCGIALDASSRGLKTALVEKSDFASGTSSKSTKLIHGGLRYLKQLDLGLVRESGTERAVVHQIAPHICVPEKMILPLVEGGSLGRFSTNLALWVYDFLAGVKEEDKRKMLSKRKALEREPLLNDKGLKGAGYYAEYRTDDARLTIELIKKAASFGAVASNYTEVTSYIHEDGIIKGVNVVDTLTGASLSVKAKKVVSAAGPWVDHLRKLNDSIDDKSLFLSKGVHVVVPRERLPLRQSSYFDVPDGRMIFAIPRGKVTYIGTTDTPYGGSLDRIVVTKSDLDYLLKAVNRTFPTVNLTKYDVISNWAGLRPLIHEDGKSPSEMSRKDEIFEAPDGLMSIAGGKLTGYRKMAERIVDKVMKQLENAGGRTFSTTTTRSIRLTDDPLIDQSEVLDYINEISERCATLGLDSYYGWYLVTNYGKKASLILDGLNPSGLNAQVALVLSELQYCMDHEMVQRIDDFLVRRTGRLYFDILSISDILEPVIDLMARQLKWSEERKNDELTRMGMLLQDATTYYDEEVVLETNPIH